MEKRVIPPAEGARLFVEPNDQTMALSAATRPCKETRTQTPLRAGLDDAGSQSHHMVGTPCPTLGCSCVGWPMFEGRIGDRGKEQSFSQAIFFFSHQNSNFCLKKMKQLKINFLLLAEKLQ